MKNHVMYTALICSGALPFALAAIAALSGVDPIPLAGAPDRVILSYGLGIISFLTGIHWATSLYLGDRSPANMFLISNVVFLVTWITFLVGGIRSAILAQSAALVVLLAIDYRLLADRLIERHYFRMRAAATLIAVLSLLSFVAY